MKKETYFSTVWPKYTCKMLTLAQRRKEKGWRVETLEEGSENQEEHYPNGDKVGWKAEAEQAGEHGRAREHGWARP